MIPLLDTLKRMTRHVFEDGIHTHVPVSLFPHMTCSGIATALTHKHSFLVSRFGWLETYAIGYRDAHGRISGQLRNKMWNTPGIFPATDEQFEKFHAEYTSAMKEVDILALMRCPYEKMVVSKYASQAHLCELLDLEPYYNPVPWSKYLENLKVLVVHPFAASIARQYATARSSLFIDNNVLPEFQLRTLKPPQTLCGNTDGHANWNDALTALKEQVSTTDFDVAIIGCGAYGLPLGAYVKRLGKVGIHIGGATQTLFGLSGNRWLIGSPVQLYMNPFWKRPTEEERPPNWEHAESGCYW